MKKRVLSLLMSFILLINLLPATARAAETIQSYFSGMPISADGGSGTTAWKVSGDMLKSGSAGTMYSNSTLTLTFTADTAVSFEYRVSSEDKYDTCTITLGSKTIANKISGNGDWIGYSGTAKKDEKLIVNYYKDGSGDKYDDCVYLRNFTCGTPVVVTFHANGGAGADYTQNIYGGKGTLTANTFTNSGKVFAGWATSADGKVVYADGAEITVNENTDLYAVWGNAYKVTFENDGKTTGTVDVAQNSAIGAAKMPKDPTKKGYTFEGWFNGEDKLTAETVITGNVTYTAKWTPIEYTIVLNPGDGVGEKVTLVATYDQKIKLPANTFTRDGYDFNGWSTSPSSSYGSTEDGATVKNLTDKAGATYNLYAAWYGKAVTVTVNLNYDGGTNTTRICTVGSNYNYIHGESGSNMLKDPVRTGYLFDGWFDAAEGGNEIDYSYKFTADDAKNGKTLYAHWTKGITVHFDGNGYKNTIADKTVKPDEVSGNLPYLSSYYYPSNKALDGWYIKNADGSFGEAVTKDTDFSGLDEVTLIAKWRDYQYIIKYNVKYSDKSSVTGTMADQPAAFGQDVKLNKCAFTREGYDFAGWATSTYGSTVTHQDGVTINREWDSWDSEDGESYNLYAVWTQNVFGKAVAAIQGKLPANNIVRTAGDLGLPTSGEGYTISYASSNTELLSDSGTVVLPTSGSVTVTLTATITDTTKGTTYTKEYTLTLYSAEAAQTETDLNNAVKKLTGNFVPVYGTDTNAITAVEKKLLDAGCEGIAVSIKEAAEDYNHYSGIDKDGTIHYYFNPSMTGQFSRFDTTFIFSKNGFSVEKEWQTLMYWDKAKVREALEAVADTLTVPETATADMKLPIRANDKTWTTVTWLSNDSALKVNASSYYPYSVTLNAKTDTTVTLTATVKCNSVDDVAVTRTFDCTVPAGSGASAVNYQQKLDDALDDPGLKDFVTGEKLTADESGVYTTINDIQLPTTRNLKIDGKYTPVVITSSDSDVIEAPSTPNSARVWVYRPLPGQAAKTVTLTVKILSRPNGPQPGDDLSAFEVLAEKDIKISVQPLTQEEIAAEIALMEQVKEHYWDGISNGNSDQKNVTTNLHAFQECYLNEKGELTWVYDYRDLKNHGIIPDELDNWYDQQIWRLFRSSNADVVSHENLLVTRSTESKAVTITSYLSSETLGKYAVKYPQNADFQKLYKQPVSVELVVTGTKYAQGGDSTAREEAANNALTQRVMLTVSFTLTGRGMGFSKADLKYVEGSTVYDVFSDMLSQNGYTCKRRGSYIASITSNTGKTLEEFDEGKNSGWMYRVNGDLPNKYMSSQVLNDGDAIEVFFTSDWTREPGVEWNKVLPADLKAANEVEKLIDAIGKVTLERADAIRAAREAYDELTKAQKELVDNYDVLVAAEKALAALEAKALPFADVSAKAWYADAVKYVYENGLMDGVGGGLFDPDGTSTRGQIVMILYRLAGSPAANGGADFSDVRSGAWYADAVAWASANGVVNGYADGRFGPNDLVTREQLAAILYRYARTAGYDTAKSSGFADFADAGRVSGWAESAMRWALGCDLINGMDGRLAPAESATRAQLAAILQRFCALPKGESVSKTQRAYEDAAAYLTSAVPTPQSGSIGGEWTVIALSRGGADVKASYFNSYAAALEQTVRESKGVLSERKYTEYSRVILALSALGKDARDVAGYDLTLPLGDYEKTTAQGVNGAIYALLALDSREYPMSQNASAATQATRQMYVDAILASQLADGGWSFVDGGSADPDLTAMALQALANYQTQSTVKLAVNRALVCLSGLQNADGGFSSWGTENAESCAQMLLALSALGIDGDDARFVKNGHGVLDALLTYQTANGGFCHVRGEETNLMASEQAACALASLVRAERGETSLYRMETLSQRAAA